MSELFISREQAEADLLACAAFIGERIKSSDGHAEVMNAVVPRYLARGEADLAAELANAVDDPYSRDRLLTAVAVNCAETGDDEYALQLADAIEDHGLRSQALERVGSMKAAQGGFEKADEIAAMMTHPDFVYAAIAVRQAADGSDAAEITLKRIDFPAARVAALQQIAQAKIAHDDIPAAVQTLDAAISAANEIEHDEEKIRALIDIANLFLDAKRNDLAIDTFESARSFAEKLDNMHRDFFIVNCSLGFLYSGSNELADRALDLVGDKTQMASALLAFARESWKKDAKEDAAETLDESHAILKSQTDAETRDSRARNQLMAAIAAQFAGFGKTDRGVEIALENSDQSEQTAALSQIAQILTVRKEDALARQTIELIAEDSDRLLALIAVADEKKEANDAEGATSLLSEAATLAETVPQLASRSNVLNHIAARFAESGEPDRARNAVDENLKIVSDIRDESSKASSLAVMSDLFGDGGMELTGAEREHLIRLVQKAEQ